MKRLLFGAVCVAAFAIHAAPSSASCVATLNWHGHAYRGYGPFPSVKTGAVLARPAQVPSCNDTIGPDGPPPVTYTDQTVTRVRSIASAIAVAANDLVYVSQSTFPALKSHPLHNRIPADNERPITGKRCTVEGMAQTDVRGLFVNGARIVVGAKTKVGPQRHGTGFVPPGMRIRVVGSACGDPYGGGTKHVQATRITRVRG